jgi:hypothetical protein
METRHCRVDPLEDTEIVTAKRMTHMDGDHTE